MKKILFLLLIPFYGISQEVVKRSDLYQIPDKDILGQFVIEHSGIDAKTAYSSVRKWASSAFVNTKEVTVSEGDDFIVYKPILKFFYSGAMNISTEAKFTAHTKFEFKDGRTRVTITDLPSLYISGASSASYIMWPHYTGKTKWPLEYKNKGSYKSYFRRFTDAIAERDKWINTIKSINFSGDSDSSSDDDW
tara:strand:+ start:207 stop:782 length:576 start_codon:yes stop_codon:yes gene_type:complete